LKLDDLNIHIIIGGSGRCMCGIYDGVQMSCWQILVRVLGTSNTFIGANYITLKPDKNAKVPEYVMVREI
jgi:hypothetical protein